MSRGKADGNALGWIDALGTNDFSSDGGLLGFPDGILCGEMDGFELGLDEV